VRDRLDELGDDTEVVLITFTDPANLSAYQAANDLPFTTLIDPDRRVYRAYGLGRGRWWRIWGWRAARKYLEIGRQSGWRTFAANLRAGGTSEAEDTLQLGGNFIVAADGTLAWAYQGQGPDDRPTIDQLIAALHVRPAPRESPANPDPRLGELPANERLEANQDPDGAGEKRP